MKKKTARAKKGIVLKRRGISIKLGSRKRRTGTRKEHHLIEDFFKHKAKPGPELIEYRKPSNKLTTEVDDMLQIVSEKKKIRIDVLAKKMGVTEDKVEEWANMLEEQGFVSIHYPAFGKPEVRIGEEKAGE